MLQSVKVSPIRVGSSRAVKAHGVEVPQPAPDVVPLPPSQHPVPPPPPHPPEIIEAFVPGQNEPIRDPIVPVDITI